MNTENSDTQKEILETLQKMNRVLMVIEENQQMNSKDLEDIKTNTFETFKSNSEGNSILSNLKWVLLAIGVMFFATFRLGL